MITLQDWRLLLSKIEFALEKVLSANDVGDTKSHQAGFLIPHKIIGNGMFPELKDDHLNPRMLVTLVEMDSGTEHLVNYIKYNNRKFGGTRYEYRLTGVKRVLNLNTLRAGDSIVFVPKSVERININFIHRNRLQLSNIRSNWNITKERGNNE